ncbi:unnamed protein product [Camellia sinensis]
MGRKGGMTHIQKAKGEKKERKKEREEWKGSCRRKDGTCFVALAFPK